MVLSAAQQLSITALHHGQGVLDQTIGLAPDRRTFPFDGRELCRIRIEQFGRDLARASAAKPVVKSMQQQNQPRPAHRRQLQHSRRWLAAPSTQAVIEAHQNADPQFEILIERQDRGGTDGSILAEERETMVALGIREDHLAIV